MGALRYTSIAAPSEAEVEVKRSRFLARVEPVATEEHAREVIEAARSRHWDARHHCTAFVLGPRADTRRSSDDGEPSGTAGAPMLDVLIGRELTNVVAVVTRWFGGTLLGTGGLARAYTDAVAAAIDAATLASYAERTLLSLDVPSGLVGKVENMLRADRFTVREVEYGAHRSVLTIEADPSREQAVRGLVAGATSGAAVVEAIGSGWAVVSPR